MTHEDPRLEYGRRLEARAREVRRYEQISRRIAAARLAAVIALLVMAWLVLWRDAFSGWWLMVPAGAFVVLALVHIGIDAGVLRAREAVRFYEDGLARIEDPWIGRRPAKEPLRDESHLYAADLDLFGEASLFELLSTARTRSGEETLADWLAAPAARSEILARQQAVEELRSGIDLREDFATLGAGSRATLHPDRIRTWAAAPVVLGGRVPRILGLVIAAILWTALGAVLSSGSSGAWLFMYGALVVAGGFGAFYRRRVRSVGASVDEQRSDFELLSPILTRLEQERFRSDKLAAIRSSLDADGLPPSRQLARFARLADMLDWRRGEMVLVLLILAMFQPAVLILPFSFLLWSTQMAFALEDWRTTCGTAIGRWVGAVGELEALSALAGYAYEHPSDPFPEIVDEEVATFDGQDLGHPLIPSNQGVRNSVRLGAEPQLLVVSGSNMSGKSTLLRTVGVNAVMALAGAPVRARRLRLSVVAIGATLRIQDSLQAGTSRFYNEIRRIRQIKDLTAGVHPALFLLDEVLHGTNSHDRAVGAEAIVRGLIDRGAIGLATTHDLALAEVADKLAPRAVNVHFEDDIREGKVVFDYKMRAGVVSKSNALELMRAVGLEV